MKRLKERRLTKERDEKVKMEEERKIGRTQERSEEQV